MKRLFFILCCMLAVNSLCAQKLQTGYLFENFENAFVYYKDGRKFNVPLNYNLLTRQYEFIDQKDNDRKKEFTEPGMIVTIEVGKRRFLSPTEGATEIIQVEPAFYVTYQGIAQKKGASVGYGGTTTTGSASNYTGIKGNFIVGGIANDEKALIDIDKAYRVKVGKKMKTFYDKKRFLKLFPSEKEVLDKYIEDNKIDFGVIEQVLELYNYAMSLK